MNGDSYSSRGMASTLTAPRKRPEAATDEKGGTDNTRHSSSRDYYSSRGGEREDRRDHRDRDRDRRRSRSPGYRSSRTSRRDEVDTYSSSRDYRAKEREDRYSGGSRREDRDWDRDRGSGRRETRREDEGRGGSRRDRDLFEDRMRPPRRDRERDAFGGGGRERPGGRIGGGDQRKKSASPPPKKKEPTPDLTDVVPILERKRRLTQWDIKPPGYENITAEQAKLSGMFPLPGAPRQQPMDASRLQAFMAQPSGNATTTALKPLNARQSKRLFVSNLPASATDDSIIQFFNLQLNNLNVTSANDPCISAQISKDRSFALLEFRAPGDATVGLALDGIHMESHAMDSRNGSSNGSSGGLTIRRPKDYIVPSVTEDSEESSASYKGGVPDTPNKISITNIPSILTDEQISELLVTFGELKAFVLVKENGTEESRGIAFCEYADPAATDIAVEGLNGMEIVDRNLKVQRASIGVQQASGLEMGVGAMSMLAATKTDETEDGRVLQLLNMVTAEELMDNEDYEEICEDVKEECEKYGPVLDMKIPRPSGGSRQSAGVGKIFIRFNNAASASNALKNLAGRKFADRTVVVTYFSEENFEVNAW